MLRHFGWDRPSALMTGKDEMGEPHAAAKCVSTDSRAYDRNRVHLTKARSRWHGLSIAVRQPDSGSRAPATTRLMEADSYLSKWLVPNPTEPADALQKNISAVLEMIAAELEKDEDNHT